MKEFIICLCIIALILIVVIINSVYTKNVTSKLIEGVKLLNEDYDNYESLTQLWDKNIFWIGLSSSTKETDKIEDMLAAIGSLYRSNDLLGLEEKKSLLINYIRLIANHEKIGVENML